jgi:formylglycine-generating enzyme
MAEITGGSRTIVRAGAIMLFLGAFPPALAPVRGQAIDTRKEALQRELDAAGMVMIPGGEFMMGAAPDEVTGLSSKAESWMSLHARPQHRVRVVAFALAKYHVTRGDYARFVQETGRSGSGCILLEGQNETASADWRAPGFPQTDRDPVVCVSYEDARAYAAWWSQKQGHEFRLPTEAEWEYAARAGTTTAYWWGTDESRQCSFANGADQTYAQRFPNDGNANPRCSDGYMFTAPVGSFRPNPWGLYDMSGNAWELMADCWNDDYDGAPADGTARTSGDCTKRAVRGGSWNSPPANLRAGNRNRTLADRDSRAGFRLARTLP